MGGVAARNSHAETSFWSSVLRPEAGRYPVACFSTQLVPGSEEGCWGSTSRCPHWEAQTRGKQGVRDHSLTSKDTNLQYTSKQSGEGPQTVTSARWWLSKQSAEMSQVQGLPGEPGQQT